MKLSEVQTRIAKVFLTTADKSRHGIESGQHLKIVLQALGVHLNGPGRLLNRLWNESNDSGKEARHVIECHGRATLTIFVDANLHRMKMEGTKWIGAKMTELRLSSDYADFGAKRLPTAKLRKKQ